MPRGRKRTLPDATPRVCPVCKITFTPVRKKWKQVMCSGGCQIKAFQIKGNEPAARAIATPKLADTQRYRGRGVSYVKLEGRHMHRVLMERMIGRPLKKGEIVHHINGNHRDNRPENLQLLGSQSEHCRLHFTKRK